MQTRYVRTVLDAPHTGVADLWHSAWQRGFSSALQGKRVVRQVCRAALPSYRSAPEVHAFGSATRG